MGSEEELAKQRAELGNMMLAAKEQITPMLDAADGMRKEMEGRGWSPTAAETVALQWLCSMLAMALKS